MKVLENIKKFGRFLKLSSAVALLCFMATSCREDDGLSSGNPEIPEGMEEITFLIPDYNGNASQFGTRSNTTEDEGNMSNLYVIAFKYKEYTYDENNRRSEKTLAVEDRTVYPFLLNPEGVNFKVGDKNYKEFKVTLYPGLYKFAVVANLDRYLARANRIMDFTKEEDLKNITLNFYEDVPLIPLHLPMVCLPEEIKYKEKNADGSYSTEKKVLPVEIEENSTIASHPLLSIEKNNDKIICADMKFICSKVRYTILFDKTEDGISKNFGSAWIRFNVDDAINPFATNLKKQTIVVDGQTPDIYDSVNTLMVHGWTKDAATSSASGSASTIDDGETGDDAVGNGDGWSGETDSGENEEEQPEVVTYGWWTISLDRFKWHADGANYPTMPHYPDGQDLTPWDGTLDQWIASEQKVWQGVVYLPENIDPDKNKRTILEFPYHTKANSADDTEEKQGKENKKIILFGNPGEGQYGLSQTGTPENEIYGDEPIGDTSNDYSIGLKRNYMYDVVAKVVSPDIDEMDIRVFVSIIPWHEIDQSITDPDGNSESSSSESNYNSNVKDWNMNGSKSKW